MPIPYPVNDMDGVGRSAPHRRIRSRKGRGMGLHERDHGSLALWAADCAEHVLPYFEETHPKDDRP
jgi:hypothetical protein